MAAVERVAVGVAAVEGTAVGVVDVGGAAVGGAAVGGAAVSVAVRVAVRVDVVTGNVTFFLLSLAIVFHCLKFTVRSWEPSPTGSGGGHSTVMTTSVFPLIFLGGIVVHNSDKGSIFPGDELAVSGLGKHILLPTGSVLDGTVGQTSIFPVGTLVGFRCSA